MTAAVIDVGSELSTYACMSQSEGFPRIADMRGADLSCYEAHGLPT